jgi:hypothetical protein
MKEYPSRILDFLTSICAPGGKGNYIIQKWALEMMIGKKVSGEVCPSSLIFHSMIHSSTGEEADRKIYMLTDNWGFQRPRYIGSKRNHEENIEYNEGMGTQMLDETRIW